MFIHGKSLAFSFIIHLILFLFLYLFFLYKTPPIPLLPQKRVVTLKVVRNIVTNESVDPEIIPEESLVKPPVPVEKKIPPKKPPGEIEETEPVKEPEAVGEPIVEAAEPEPPAKVEEEIILPKEEEIRSFRGDAFSYSHNEAPVFDPLEDALMLPADDILIDDLLIVEEKAREGVDSLYSIELRNADNRRIMEVPDLVFDMKDPILGTLADCRIGFTVTEEGLVRDIQVIPPGTGSETYDEILENIVSRFLFTPGERDEGIIAINFSRIGGDRFD